MINDIQSFKEINDRLRAPDLAGIFRSSTGENAEARVLTIDLTTARDPASSTPYVINFPFKSLCVVGATDSSVSVNIRLSTTNSYQDSFPLKKGTSFVLPQSTDKAYIDWSAQSGKTITILVMTSGEFRSNILDLVNSGGVTLTDGTAVTNRSNAALSLAANTPTIVLPADSTRKIETLVNRTGVTLWLGDGNVTDDNGAYIGIECPSGSQFQWRNTSALYAFSTTAIAAGAKIGRVMET